MHRYLCAAFAVLFLVTAGPAFAQVAAAPETIAQAVGEGTKVTWAWGATLSSLSGALLDMALAGLALAFGVLAKSLPGQVYAFLVSIRAEQLLQKGIEYGINAVAGAAKDKTLTVDVGNRVLAEALQYVLDNMPGWLQQWMGGPDAIAKKIFARLNLPAESNSHDVQAIASRVAG